MKSKSAKNLLDQIDNTIVDIQSFSMVSQQQESYFAKFLVVYICGIYEIAIETIINEMVAKLGNKFVEDFIKNSIDKTFRNPEVKNLKSLLNKFNVKWKTEIDKLPNEELDALNSIVINKNSLAHGVASTITLKDAVEYYQKSKKVIEKVDDIIL